MDCLFCKIIDQEISSFKVYENDYVYAFLDVNPVSNGHTLIIPKKHFDDFSSTDELYLTEVAKAKKIIVKLLEKSLSPAGYNYISNEQAIANQVIFHYHEHIIPKYFKDEGYLHNKNVTNLENLELIINNIDKIKN